MFARVSTLTGDPAKVDESVTYVREKIIPDASQLPGMRGMISMADRSTGKMISITFWDSEEALQSTEESANKLRADAAGATDATIASVERYEVVIDERR